MSCIGKWLLLWGVQCHPSPARQQLCPGLGEGRPGAPRAQEPGLPSLIPSCAAGAQPGCCFQGSCLQHPCGFRLPTGDRICMISGIRAHVELAVKPQVVPFSHFSLQTQNFELSLVKKASISCRCERALCCPCTPSYAWFPI